ncbi:virulence-associated E family protein [Synechococcus sp. CS-1324]|uniref:virulence-associated E family protein n=1 Tax=Synechococcus sp. CS-1324 TaxID=2847980 RepID=UPI00223C3C83|nr:virulence-associated E family protein [Synechococcus sp. CS-1324]
MASAARRHPAAPAALPAAPEAPITLLRLPQPADVVRLDLDGPIKEIDKAEFILEAVYPYSPSQEVIRLMPVTGGAKKFSLGSIGPDGSWIPKQGADPWPLWRQAEAVAAAMTNPGHWLLEAEGEKAAEIAREGGLVTVSQPGHAHRLEDIQPRYAALKAAGVAGIVYLADEDLTGARRAQKALEAAAAVGLSLVVLPASEVWPGLPVGGSIDDASGTPAERVAALEGEIALVGACEWGQAWQEWGQATGLLAVEVQPVAAASIFPGLEDAPGVAMAAAVQEVAPTRGHSRPVRLEHHEILRFLPDRLGSHPRLNIRTRDVHLADRILSGDEAARLYLQLSTELEKWPKEATADAVEHLAAASSFDPVLEELQRITATADPLPIEDWNRLDLLLFNIDDPVAAAFLPRFLIAAVARVMLPGCQADQTPVLIGPQGIGKTQTGRVLFGGPFFGDGLTNRFDIDDITRLQRVWALELSEVDGITRRTDQEALKAFLTRQVDIDRRKYARSSEVIHRRSVFWGTSNGAPLRDLSGSRRFVCIALPKRPLPLEAVASLRPAIWARALERYHSGVPWHSSREEEEAISVRNADHQQLDPWAEELADYLSTKKAMAPFKAADLLGFLEVPKDRQTPAIATRLRQVMEAIGWEQRRPQIGGRRVQGFYPGA